jgi:transposase
MFVRKTTSKNKNGTTRTYVQIVQGYRENGKVRHKIIANLGRLEKLQEGEIDNLLEHLSKFSKETWIKSRPENLKVEWTKQWGPALVYHRLWEELSLGSHLRTLLESTEITSPLEEAAFAMVLNRLCDPQSKLGVSEWVNTVHRPEFSKLKLQHYYKALDFLADHKEKIEVQLFSRIRSLFNMELDLVFWDTTSTYFEGSGPEELAKYGFSKDKRPDRLQIVIGLLMTKEGIPVAHQIFPGSTNDTKTFTSIVDDLKKRFNITRVIMVGDRGMVSKKILKELRESGLEYIVGLKMRRLKGIDDMISWRSRYLQVKNNLKVKEVRIDGWGRYILCLNPEAQKRDQMARKSMVAKLEQKLKNNAKSLVGNRGYRRYLTVDGKAVGIDRDKLRKEARFDGKYLLLTNCDLPMGQVALAYKDLWKVERAFRELKSGLDLRPIYHWTDTRVRGHVMVCFLALVLESALQKNIRDNNPTTSFRKVMKDLAQMQAVKVSFDDQHYLTRSELQGDAFAAFKAVKARPPLHMQILNSDKATSR